MMWELGLESALLIFALVGVSISALLTTDSWVRYLRVKDLLDGNYFPRMHLRIDVALFFAQLAMGLISLNWFLLLLARHPEVVTARDDLWLVFPLRTVVVVTLLVTQAWNAVDRHRMHFGDRAVPYDRRMGQRRGEPVEKEK